MANNIVDKFLDRVEREANKKIVYQRVLMRPSKAKSVIGFIVSLVCFLIMLGFFSFTLFFWFLFIINIVILIFYAVNVFSEKGIGLPKTIAIELPSEEEEEESFEEEPNYFPDMDEEDDDSELEEDVVNDEDEERQ